MKKFFTKKVLIFSGIVLLVLVLVILKLNGDNGEQIVVAQRADIIRKVFSSGKVKPNQNVQLGFDRSGRVANVRANVGDVVLQGEVIATLESSELLADLSRAEASLKSEELRLAEVQKTAPITFNDASKNLSAEIRKSFAIADDAVRNKVDQFFEDSPQDPKFEVSIVSGNFVHYFNVPYEKVLEINNLRKNIETVLIDWQNRLTRLDTADLVLEANKAIDDLNTISAFLDEVASAVNTFTPAEYAYDTTVNGYKTTIAGARSSVSGAVSAVVLAKDKLNTAPSLSEGGQFRNVLTQETAVSQAKATISSLQASLEKTIIRAPFDGVVTLQEAKPGEAVSAGNVLVSIMSQDAMYVEANISEIHISKIAVGNPVSITLDAFPDKIFTGKLSYIEPGEVLVDGVVNYKIRAIFDNFDSKIKSGLTANLEIQTNKISNVIAIPLYAIKKEGDQNFVNKIQGRNIQKVPVSLGLSGNDGLVEILEGLEEGDEIEF